MKGALPLLMLAAHHGRPGLEVLILTPSEDQCRHAVIRSVKQPPAARQHPRLVVLAEQTGRTLAMELTTHQDSGRIRPKEDEK